MTTPSDPFSKEPAPGYGAPPSGYGDPFPGGVPAGSPFGHPGGPQLASWGQRVGAALIDAALVFGIIIATLVVGLVFGAVSDVLATLVIAVGYIAAIGFAFWQLWVQGQTGQTIGKQKVGLRLLREQDGQVIGGGLSIGRYFLHVVDQIPCYVGYLWPLWDAKRQTFADKILKTVVVKA